MAFILNVVLARILLPEDFGSVALISSFLAILQVLGELGISAAIVQKRILLKPHSTVLLMTVILRFLLAWPYSLLLQEYLFSIRTGS